MLNNNLKKNKQVKLINFNCAKKKLFVDNIIVLLLYYCTNIFFTTVK